MHLVNVRHTLLSLIGAAEGLLLARLVLRLMAARPDNAAVSAILALTEPLRAPLAALDAAQPRFGAVLELSTLAAMLALPALGLLVWWVLSRALPGRAAEARGRGV